MRKYTICYYLDFLKKINTVRLQSELTKFCDTVVLKIHEKYKKLVKGYFIDYVAKFEDFWMVVTYRIEDMLPVGLNVIRQRNGKTHQQYYSLCCVSYFGNETAWMRRKMNYCQKRYCYTSNLKDLFKGTEFEYSKVWELGNNIDIKIRNLLAYCLPSHIRKIECLTELKCFRLARDVMNGYGGFIGDDKNITKALKLNSRNEVKKVIDLNMGVDDLRSYINFSRLRLDFKYFNCLKVFLRYFEFPYFDNFSAKSFLDYYLQQKKDKLFLGSFDNFVRDYQDYLKFGADLKYNFKDTKYSKPYNFKLAHDQAYLKFKSKKNTKLDAAVKRIMKKYQGLAFENGEYCILVPKIAEEIRLEGKNMHNCVGGYIDRVASGNSLIFFVRHVSERAKSFYTLELDPWTLKIVQCRGYKNNPTPEESKVQQFVKKWQRDVVLKKLAV